MCVCVCMHVCAQALMCFMHACMCVCMWGGVGSDEHVFYFTSVLLPLDWDLLKIRRERLIKCSLKYLDSRWDTVRVTFPVDVVRYQTKEA